MSISGLSRMHLDFSFCVGLNCPKKNMWALLMKTLKLLRDDEDVGQVEQMEQFDVHWFF